MSKKEFIAGKEDLPSLAAEILKSYSDKKIFCLHGDLGAGKTSLIREFCKALDVQDNTGSPTFSLINEYHTIRGDKVYHLDLYRLKNKEELMDLGIEEYLYSGKLCFVEWPELMESMLPNNAVHIYIEPAADRRVYRIS